MSDQDFNSLRQLLLRTKRLSELDPRDCTLYYAEWWKRYYDGGFPSKKEVFGTISNGQYYDDEAFYQIAKRGAEMLRIKWIKNQNTLYFKTLLLQGGLPVHHISNNKSAYKNLLLKLLEINPTSVDDFAFNPHVTSLLPPSSRNDEIYECCLSIVRAIIDDDQLYVDFFSSNESLNEISQELRIKRQRLQLTHKLPTFKSSWVFEPSRSCIRLYLGIPDLSAADFQEVFGIDNDVLDFEYKLYYNDQLLCKLIKRADDTFRVKWIDNNDLVWDGTDRIPDFYLMTPAGRKLNCPPLIGYLPDLDKPGLWSRYSEKQWVMEKGKHTAAKEGFLLYPASFSSSLTDTKNILLQDREMIWAEFENTATIYGNGTCYLYSTSQRKIDWTIHGHRPKWLKRANMAVVRRKPFVSVFDETGEQIAQKVLKWRFKHTDSWNEWNTTLPVGMIEVQIQAAGVTEYDCFFNIGTLDLVTSSKSLRESIVKITGSEFLFSISEGPLVDIQASATTSFTLSLKSNESIPNAIQAAIRASTQRSGLLFEIEPPFMGTEVLDSYGQIVNPQTPLSLHSLQGMRLMCNQENLHVNVWNNRRPGMVMSEDLPVGLIPLRNFGDKIMQLYALSDTMDGEALIWLEIFEKRSRAPVLLKKYCVHRYDSFITATCTVDGLFHVQLSRGETELLAIPLDCTASEMVTLELERDGGRYEITRDGKLEKFIIFAKTNQFRVQPAFISLDRLNVPTDDNDRKLRVLQLIDQLLLDSPTEDSWQRFLTYYNVCFDHGLPYSTFDILRAVGFSSLIAAKAFAFLICYDGKDGFKDGAWEQMEQDIGFSFHWISRSDWDDAFQWICANDAPESMSEISASLISHLENLQPARYFQRVMTYVLQGRTPDIQSGFHLNTRVNDLRSLLGSRVVNELPKTFPLIPEKYQHIIPVNHVNQNVEILLRAPVIVALSIAGKDNALWHRDNEHKRRNIRYSQQLAPEWYAEALNYCITKI